MSLSYSGYSVADINVTGLFGRTGIGVSLLCFSVSFRVPRTAPEGIRIRSLQLRIFAEADPGGIPAFMGFAEPEVPFELTTKPGEDQRTLIFELSVTQSQLFALEKLRGRHGLHFRFKFSVLADGPKGVWPQQDEISYRVNLSDWARVLGELHGPEYLVIGVETPRCNKDHALAEAVGRIQSAHGYLVVGRFDAVISECRMAIESAVLAAGERAAVSSAVERLKSDKREMTKLDREFALVEAVRHYTHLAHHVDQQGSAEYYSKDDANMLLATAASLVASSIARMQDRDSCLPS